ncbi:MAG: hypothetical protein Q7Q71_00690 [Verrucomicrobiota bacterium JB023]|nr:hypothetical protein [Verrucomicrobiota bacterium JB023]
MNPALASFIGIFSGFVAGVLYIYIRLSFYWTGPGETGVIAFFMGITLVPIYLFIVLPLSFWSNFFSFPLTIRLVLHPIIGAILATIAMYLIWPDIAKSDFYLVCAGIVGFFTALVTTTLRRAPGHSED